MKLLFDHNLSPILVDRLKDLYPNSNHVYRLGLDQAPDTEVWECKTADVETMLRNHFDDIEALSNSPTVGVLTLF